MRDARSSRVLARLATTATLLALLGGSPRALQAQEREIVSNQLAISSSEAELSLEFADGGTFTVAVRDGEVLLDGESIGTGSSELDRGWRTFLGGLVAMSDGELARALVAWEPPAALTGTDAELAGRLDEALESVLAARAPEAGGAEPAAAPAARGAAATELLRALAEADDIVGLREAIEGVDLGSLRVEVGEDITVTGSEVGSLLVVNGDVVLDGTLRGDLILVNGVLRLRSGEIRGDVRLFDARIDGDASEHVTGEVVRVRSDVDRYDLERERDRLRSELRDEIRRELRGTGRDEWRQAWRGPWRSLWRTIGGLVEDLVSFLVLSGFAFLAVYLASDRLVVVADEARRNPGKSAVVGLAACFLALPAYVLGALALIVSIVGIIALPFWLVLFPVACAVMAALGYLAVARNIGDWVAGQDVRGLEWVRPTSTFHATVTGIGAIIAFSVAGHLVGLFPFIGGALGALLMWAGGVVSGLAVLIGIGAVLLTRGGRGPDYYDLDDFDTGGWTPSAPPERGPSPRDGDVRNDEDAPADPASGAGVGAEAAAAAAAAVEDAEDAGPAAGPDAGPHAPEGDSDASGGDDADEDHRGGA